MHLTVGGVDRCDTGSTTTTSSQNMIKSPAPICTFYFCHPFGIPTPIVGSQSINTASPPPLVKVKNGRKKRNRKIRRCASTRSTVLIPWPRNTWSGNESLLPPVLQVLGKQNARPLPDIEHILATVHQAWNTPNSRSTLHSRDNNTSSSSNWDLISSTVESYAKHQIFDRLQDRDYAAANMIITTHYPSIGNGLLKRRYSVPEIIMRKHTLAQQRNNEDSVAVTAPPVHKTSVPTLKSTSYPTTTTSKTSNTRTTGSDSNLSRTPYSPGGIYGSKNTARKSSLLRHLFNKELKKHEASIRSESSSPAIRRQQRRLYHRGSGESIPCEECEKLNVTRDLDKNNIIVDPKRARLVDSSPNSRPTSEYENIDESTITATAPHQTSGSSQVEEESTTTVTPALTSNDTGGGDANKRSVLIYMTSLEKSAEDEDSAQDMLRVEIQESDYSDNNNQPMNAVSPALPQREFVSETINDENANVVKSTDDDENNTLNKEELSHFYKSALGRIKFYRDEDENVYISKILVDNLNNIAETVNDRLIIDGQKYFDQLEAAGEENNDGRQTRIIRARQIIKEGSTNSHSPASISKESTRSIELNSKMQVIDGELGMSAVQINDIINIQTIHYFPDYYADQRADLSSHTSNGSETEAVELTTVNTGSTYPLRGVHDTVILSRLSAFPRTESMEVQPPSTSPREREDEELGNVSDVSLVDSLDDPVSPAVRVLRRVYKSPESFFVPIVDPMQQIDEHLDVADAMPDSLRRRLINRQKQLMSKEKKTLRKERKAEPEVKGKGVEVKKPVEKLVVQVAKKTVTKGRKAAPVNKKSQMQSELGMLESYKIDSRGNMQIQTQAAKKEHLTNSEKTIKPTSRRPVAKKVTKPKVVEHQSFKKLPPEKKATKPSTTKGTEKMTFYPPADLTPDTEGGPKRMYQKTEIKQDGKTIEILEIVECPPENYSSGDDSSDTADGKSSKSKSKIPIPVIKPIGRPEKIADYSPETSPPMIGGGKSSFKIDKKIAGLLLEALQSPEEMGVELIRSPKDSKKSNSNRQTQGGCSFYIPAPKSRSNSSNRYMQKFDVIPEERTSFSFESSADERRDSKTPTVEPNTITRAEPPKASTPEPVVEQEKQPEDGMVSLDKGSPIAHGNQPGTPLGKSSADETLVWTNVFKQHGSGNPLESANDFEGNKHISKSTSNSCHLPPIVTPSITNALTTTASSASSTAISLASLSRQPFATSSDHTLRKYKWMASKSTISLSSSATTSYVSATTNTSSSVAHSKSYKNSTNSELRSFPPSSTESENILTIIERTMLHSETNLVEEEPPQLVSDDYLTDCFSTENCKQCKNYISENLQPMNSPKVVSPALDARKTVSNHSTPKNTPIPSPKKMQDVTPVPVFENVWQVPDTAPEMPVSAAKEKLMKEQQNQSKEMELKAKPKNSPSTPRKNNGKQEEKKPVANKKKAVVQPGEAMPKTAETCASCCFCNPELHKNSKNQTPVNCNYCNASKTGASKPDEKKTKKPNGKDSTSTTSTGTTTTTTKYYESMTKSDHVHTKTRSKDSDTVSTKCTKTNERIKRAYAPETSEKPTKGAASPLMSRKKNDVRLNRPKETNQLPQKQAFTKEVHKEVITKPIQATTVGVTKGKINSIREKQKSTFRLPSPNAISASSSTHDERAAHYSPCSAESDSSPVCSPVKSYQILSTSRWQNNRNPRFASHYHHQHNQQELDYRQQSMNHFNNNINRNNINNNNHLNVNHASHVNTCFSSHNNNNNNNTASHWSAASTAQPTPGAASNQQTPGWSVTVAGNYNPDMAPDVDLKLSFPKTGQTQATICSNNVNNNGPQCNSDRTPAVRQQYHQNGHHVPNTNNNYNNNGYGEYYDYHQNGNFDEDDDCYTNRKKHQPLPAPPPPQPAQMLPENYNPRRTLSRSDSRAQQHVTNSRHLPGVNGNSSTYNAGQVSRQTAKKAIKRVECSVAVTSATTRMISNGPRDRVATNTRISGAQRAMSFQALNQMNVGGTRITRVVGNRGVLQRDRSLDVRNPNLNHQRRMSLDDGGQTSRTCSNGSDMLSTLSVMGNSIAPECKPKVPTMSERDLTGRHNLCFTRTRPFLS